MIISKQSKGISVLTKMYPTMEWVFGFPCISTIESGDLINVMQGNVV